jgi:DNA-directed RNA polymerase sigma subunit (sigma70/sigma32)
VIEKQVLRLIRKMNHRMKHKRVDELLHLQAEIKNDGDKDGSCSTLMDVIFDEKYDLFKKKEEELEIWHKLKDIYNYIEDSQAKRIFRLLCREAIKNNNVATIERVAEKLNMTRQGIYKIIRKKIKPIVVDRMK